ncbi:hypothetical protein DY218_04710 [Streptomyces triticagri]|uniref:SalK n=1 Tax=Streptomyces triticagri TaxID=2293568 RepID=A0A372MBX5_9ACTN|nr:hypothetical protein [Streptomyces triticagri]RFU87893.1 hypothetical protein DY218_04710 [Streptomyces triticagri]
MPELDHTEYQALEPEIDRARVRQMWHLLEPLHAVLYYAPEAFDEAATLGFDVEERWPSYFAWRAAPLGALGAQRVTSAFYSFSPHMVAQHIPKAWTVARPERILDSRLTAVDRTYRALFGKHIEAPALTEAAQLARTAAESADTAGRPLAAANAVLPWPKSPHLIFWQAATILREQRGDGHLAALLAARLDPVESLVSFAAIGAAPAERFESRGWSSAEWTSARERLTARGLLDPSGVATDDGHRLRDEVEHRTDILAAGPWTALGPDRTARLADLLGDFWLTVITSGLLPSENTLGIGKI